MRIVAIAAVFALLAVPAQARGKRPSADQQQQSAEQQKKAAASEANYKASLSRIPDKKPPDPWGAMR